MNSKGVAALLLLSVLGTVNVGLGQTGEPGQPATGRFGNPTSIARVFQDYFYGVIKSLDKNELVLEKTKFGIDQTIKLAPKTKYLHDGKPSSWDQLKVGQQVWVQVKTDKKTGEMAAKRVLTGVVAPTIRD